MNFCAAVNEVPLLQLFSQLRTRNSGGMLLDAGSALREYGFTGRATVPAWVRGSDEAFHPDDNPHELAHWFHGMEEEVVGKGRLDSPATAQPPPGVVQSRESAGGQGRVDPLERAAMAWPNLLQQPARRREARLAAQAAASRHTSQSSTLRKEFSRGGFRRREGFAPDHSLSGRRTDLHVGRRDDDEELLTTGTRRTGEDQRTSDTNGMGGVVSHDSPATVPGGGDTTRVSVSAPIVNVIGANNNVQNFGTTAPPAPPTVVNVFGDNNTVNLFMGGTSSFDNHHLLNSVSDSGPDSSPPGPIFEQPNREALARISHALAHRTRLPKGAALPKHPPPWEKHAAVEAATNSQEFYDWPRKYRWWQTSTSGEATATKNGKGVDGVFIVQQPGSREMRNRVFEEHLCPSSVCPNNASEAGVGIDAFYAGRNRRLGWTSSSSKAGDDQSEKSAGQSPRTNKVPRLRDRGTLFVRGDCDGKF